LYAQLKEALMCQHGRIRLSAEDREDLKKLAGIVVPIYATAMVAMLALVVIVGGSRQSELVASIAAPASTR
jgi:hypothetical protein